MLLNFIGINEQFLVLYGNEQNKYSHSHFGIQLFIPLKEVNINGTWFRSAVIIDSFLNHFVYGNDKILTIFFYPESIIGQKIKKKFFQLDAIASLDNKRFRFLVHEMNEQLNDNYDVQMVIKQIIHELLLGVKETKLLDERVMSVLQFIHRNHTKYLTYENIIKYSFLSKTRFAHLFKEEINVSLMRYVSWYRLLNAGQQLAINNYTITEIAQQFHFFDAAHFSRAFKENFGLSPRYMLKSIKDNDCLVHVS